MIYDIWGDPFRPIGDNTVGHGVTTRIRLRKGKGARRTATLTKSPELHRQKVEFRIDESGIRDYCGNLHDYESTIIWENTQSRTRLPQKIIQAFTNYQQNLKIFSTNTVY